MSVGENIRRIRLEKGITQKELGEKSGINPAQIRRYELGGKNSNPKLETIQKIADALNVSVTELDPRINNEIDSLEYKWHKIQHEKVDELIRLPIEEVFGDEGSKINKRYEPKEKELYSRLKALTKNTSRQHKYESSAETLKRLRKENKASLKEIGQATGIPENLIARYENGERTLTLDNLSNIATYYGVSMDYIDSHVAVYGFSPQTLQDNLLEKLLFFYELLNESGQKKAIEQIKLLALVPQYRAPEPEDEYANFQHENNSPKNIQDENNDPSSK